MIMKNKGQSGIMIAVIFVIVIGLFFMYYEGYFNFKSTSAPTQNLTPNLPISLNISSTNNLAHLYTNQNINVIAAVRNYGNNYMNVVLSPYGCSFLPIQSKNVSIPPASSSSVSWSFSGSSPTSCSITFLACFNAVSYTDYPITIESYQFTGNAPTSAIRSSSGLPISISLESFNPLMVAGPSPVNSTEYADGIALTSQGSTSKLNWLSISILNGEGYFTTSSGSAVSINPSINITQQEFPLTFQNGRLLSPIPFSLLVNPVSNSIGYTSNTEINVSAGYTYCINSNSIPITLQSS